MPVQTKSQAKKGPKVPHKMQMLSKARIEYLKKQKAKKKYKVKHVELADPVLQKKEAKEVLGGICKYSKGKLRNEMLRKSKQKRITACGATGNKIAVCGYTYKSKKCKAVRVKGYCRRLTKK